MAKGTVYLDVDDEITSAAARIRGSEATKLALVMPYGSRIATSRMNFRLLSREALVNNRRLSIVASDAATRALAASAGLPVFASVAEWEAAPESPPTTPDTPGGAGPLDNEGSTPSTGGARTKKKALGTPLSEAQTLGLPLAADAAAAGAAAAGAAAAGAPAGSRPAATTVMSSQAATERAQASAAIAPPRPAQGTGRVPVVKGRTGPRIGGLAIVIAAVLVLTLVVAGVGAYVFLPAAQIVVTPRAEAMSIDLVVRADPSATAPDATANVVPALTLDLPVQASDTFTASDKRVVEEAAVGQVAFKSFNTAFENTIAKGSVVSTEGGIKFKTTASVTLPRAQIIPPSEIRPSSRTVGIVAIKPGTSGNVPANAIIVVPPGEDPTLTKVTNAAETSGGTHTEFPRISQKDVDTAIAALTRKLSDAFAADVASGAGAPPNASVFSETALLGTPTPTVPPKSLVGKEQASFDLGLTATGTVTAVDSSPVAKIAETRLLATVGADHRLVDGSIKIAPGNPTVSNGQVTFPVNAKASRVRILDRAQLLAQVKGQSVEKARLLLAQYGDVKVTPWPDWVSTIPSIDSRVTIEIVGQTDQAAGASPGPSDSGQPAATARPSAINGSPGTSSPSGGASPAASAAP
jgi:hypothetical protein